jgi:mercuric ion binding protein
LAFSSWQKRITIIKFSNKKHMKKLIIALIATVALSTAVWAQTEKEAPKEGPQTVKIKTSAVCDMCKETIEKAMAYEKGVKEATLDVDSKILTVTYDPKKTTLEKIKIAITKTGYDADEMASDSRAYSNLNPCCKKDAKH